MNGSNNIDIGRYFALLWKWLWLILLGAALAGVVAYVVSSRQTPIYEAIGTVVVSSGQGAVMTDYYYDSSPDARKMQTYAQWLLRRQLLVEAASQLGISASVASVAVSPVPDTQFLVIRVRHTDPQAAADLANTLPVVFNNQNEATQTQRFSSSKESLNQEMQRQQAQIVAAQESLAKARAASPQDTVEITRLETLLAQYSATYTNLLSSYASLRMAEIRGIDQITLADPAVAPAEPVLPRTVRNAALAALVGAMLAVATAFVVEYLDDTIKRSEDVQRLLDQPVLGTIVRVKSGRDRHVASVMIEQAQSPVAEAYRALRTNLDFIATGMGKTTPVLLVTSARPLEGKTTTVANLGAAIAQMGKNVLLVDADLRRPALHRQFGLVNNTGLRSLIVRREASLERAMRNTMVKGLRVITSGRQVIQPAELLSFPETSSLLERLRELTDYVILDCPPVLSVVDATILAQKVDGVLLVVEAGKTRTELVRQALARLESVRAPVWGVVVNKSAGRTAGYGYEYYSHEAGKKPGNGAGTPAAQ